MSAVSPVLFQTIKELQNLPCLSEFALAGGTNLALRYAHRKSIDIDLFCPDIIGFAGFQTIQEEVAEYFGEDARSFIYPCKENDQYVFFRFLIFKHEDVTIKVEVLQNMKTLYDIEVIDDIRYISKKDIGLFKLVSASNRCAKKDIYDLDYITDEIALPNLFDDLVRKKALYNEEEHKTIFDLDGEENPTDNPQLLLKFDDDGYSVKPNMPQHTNDTIDIIEGNKNWLTARSSWRQKVRQLYRHMDLDYPSF